MDPTTPKQIVESWIERFNAGDAAGLAELYHPDAVNHQVTQEPVVGRKKIRAMFEREFANATMTCIPEAIHECGEIAALEWRDPVGLRGCGFFTIRNGLISFQRGYWDKLSFLKFHGLPIE
jgi:limonene-1,2-epoxide hydrolase